MLLIRLPSVKLTRRNRVESPIRRLDRDSRWVSSHGLECFAGVEEKSTAIRVYFTNCFFTSDLEGGIQIGVLNIGLLQEIGDAEVGLG